MPTKCNNNNKKFISSPIWEGVALSSHHLHTKKEHASVSHFLPLPTLFSLRCIQNDMNNNNNEQLMHHNASPLFKHRPPLCKREGCACKIIIMREQKKALLMPSFSSTATRKTHCYSWYTLPLKCMTCNHKWWDILREYMIKKLDKKKSINIKKKTKKNDSKQKLHIFTSNIHHPVPQFNS